MLAAAAGLFASTLSDAIQVADSGEMVAVACNGGVAHPPGYPLYTLLGGLFCELPVSTPAGRLSLLSAAAGLASVFFTWALVARASGSRAAAFFAAAALATGWLFWRYASVPEVFSLHVALCLFLVWAVLSAGQSRSQREHLARSALVGLAGGLALANHHSAVWLGPLAAAAVLVPVRGLGRLAARAGAASVGLAAGLSPYLHLLSADPAARPRWGAIEGASSLLHHVLRRDYGTFQLSIGGEGDGADVLAHFAAGLPAQLGGSLALFAGLGWVLLLLRAAGRAPPGTRGIRRDLAGLLALSVLLAGPLFFSLFNLSAAGVERQVVERFFLLPIALLAICLGVGLAAAEARLCGGRRRLRMFAGAGVLFVLAATVPLHHLRADASESYAVEDYGRNLLATAEPGALVLGAGDVRLFSVTYAQEVLGLRRDVQYVDVYMLLYPWYVDQQRRAHPQFDYRFEQGRADTIGLVARSLRAGRPVYLANPYSELVASLPSYPVGPLRRLSRGGDLPPPSEVIATNRDVFAGLVRRGRPPDPELDPWSADLREPFARTWLLIARLHRSAGRHAEADEAVARARAWAPWYER